MAAWTYNTEQISVTGDGTSLYDAAKTVNTYFNRLSAEWFSFVFQYNDARASEVISVSYDDLETGVYNYLSAANYTYTGVNMNSLVMDKLYQIPEHLQLLMYHTYHTPEIYQQKAGLLDTPRVLYYDGTTGMWRFANNKNLTDGFADFTGVIGNVYPAERRIELVLNGVIYNYSEQPFIPGEVYYLTDLLDGWMVPYQEGGDGRMISVPMAVAVGRNSAILLSNRGMTKDLPCEKICPPVSLTWRENQILYRPKIEPPCDKVALHIPSNMTGAQTITGDCLDLRYLMNNSNTGPGSYSMSINAAGNRLVVDLGTSGYGGFAMLQYNTTTQQWDALGRAVGSFDSRPYSNQVATNGVGDLIAFGNARNDLQGNDSRHGSLQFYDYDAVTDRWTKRGTSNVPRTSVEPANDRSVDIVGTTSLMYWGNAPQMNHAGDMIISYAQGWSSSRLPYAAVYRVDANQKWTMVDDKLSLSSGNALVDISGDGTVILVGERNTNGTCRVYKLDSDDVWQQTGADIDVSATWQSYGFTTSNMAVGLATGKGYSLSKDGTTVAFGCPVSTQSTGAVVVFRLSGPHGVNGEWVQLGAPIFGEANESIGYDVDLSADGNTLMITTQARTNAYQYKYNSTGRNWELQFQFPGGGTSYGSTVKMNDQGNVIAVASNANNGVCVFGQSNNPTGPGDPTVPIIPPKKIFDRGINNFDVTHNTSVVSHNNSYAKYGASSIKFPGTEDGLLTVSPGNKLDLQKQDFCIEFWVLFEDQMRHDFIMGLYDQTNRRKSWHIESPGTQSGLGTGMVFTLNNGVESDNILIRFGFDYEFLNHTWYHVGLSRQGNTWRWNLNGLEQESRLTAGSYNCTVPSFAGSEFRMGAPGQPTHVSNVASVVLDGLKITSGEVVDASVDDIYALELERDLTYISDTTTCDTYSCGLNLDIENDMLDVSESAPLMNGEWSGNVYIEEFSHHAGSPAISHDVTNNWYQFKVRHPHAAIGWAYTHYVYSLFNDTLTLDSDANKVCLSVDIEFSSSKIVSFGLVFKQGSNTYVKSPFYPAATNTTINEQNVQLSPSDFRRFGTHTTEDIKLERGQSFSVGICFGQSYGSYTNTVTTLKKFKVCVGAASYNPPGNTCTVYLSTPINTVNFALLRTRDVPQTTTVYVKLLDQNNNWIDAVAYEPTAGDPRIMTSTQILSGAQAVHGIQWKLDGTSANTQLLQLKSGNQIREWAEFRTARDTRTVPLLGYIDDCRITIGESVFKGNCLLPGKPHPICT